MSTVSETALRTAISHAALSASLAFSFAAIGVEDAQAQQNPPADPNARNVELETIQVEGEGEGEEGDGLDGDTLNPKASASVKATAPLLNTPQTVSIIPKKILEERNAQTLTEALKNTPGISFDAGENGFAAGTNAFYMRGFNTSGQIFNDGARDNGSYTRDMFNVERVEVFKGPAADNGRGSAGGYINIVTKVPYLDNFYNGNVGFGFDEYTDPRWRGTADVNQQIGETSAVRLNAMVEDGNVPGRDVAENSAWGFAPSLAFGLGTDFRAYLTFEHVERDDIPDSGVAINRAATDFGGTGVGVGVEGAGPRPYVRNLPRDTFFGLPSDYDDIQSDVALARFEYDVTEWITISNQTRWSYLDRESIYHNGGGGNPNAANSPGPAIGAGPFDIDRTNESLSNLTNVRAEFDTGSIHHTVSTGLDLAWESMDSARSATESAHVDVDTAAFYFFDTVEFNERWSITGGLRAEHYEADVLSVGTGLPGDPAASTSGAYDVSETTLGGKIGVVYKPAEEGSVYVSYGLSHLPHGSLLSNPDTERTGTNAFATFIPGADPVELHNYEAGVKWDFFNGDLSTTAAVFHTEKHKVAYLRGTDPADYIAYGEQHVTGIELGVAGKINDAWSVFGGLVVLDSERKHSALLNTTDSASDGDELSATPNITASLWTTYRWNNGFTLGGGFQYVGESWVGRPDDGNQIVVNGASGKIPDYFLINLMAAYEVNENITVRFNVDNVFDELYVRSVNFNGNWGYLGAPRTFWLSTSFEF